MISFLTVLRLKFNPPLLRNAPPIGGTISWIRQLIKKVDEPMKVFKENKYVSSLNGMSFFPFSSK